MAQPNPGLNSMLTREALLAVGALSNRNLVTQAVKVAQIVQQAQQPTFEALEPRKQTPNSIVRKVAAAACSGCPVRSRGHLPA